MKKLSSLIVAITFLFGVAVIFDGCKKEEDPYYISNEDFINYMKGEWKVTRCLGPDIWIYWQIDDTLRYDYRTPGIDDERYSTTTFSSIMNKFISYAHGKFIFLF